MEIERKFLLSSSDWQALITQPGIPITQGYIPSPRGGSIRIRTKGDQGYITFKSDPIGAVRQEYEYPIPLTDAKALLEQFPVTRIEKVRHEILNGNRLWEIDVFTIPANLTLAELELEAPDAPVDLPPWIGQEVTGNKAYRNDALAVIHLEKYGIS